MAKKTSVPEAGSLPDLECDGREHRLSAPRYIVTVKVTYREKFSFSVPNPSSCKGLDPLGDFSSSAAPQSSRRETSFFRNLF